MNHFTWNIDPEVLRLGPIPVRWYGLLFASAFLMGYLITTEIYRSEKHPEENLAPLFTYIFLGTLIGARLGHVLFYQPDYYLWRPREILMIWQGGLASHGGFIGVLFAIYLYSRKHADMDFLALSDRLAIPSLLAASLIRIGNFFNSEILGEPSNVPWAIIFAQVDNIPRHPAMLYESIAYTMIFAGLYVAYRKTAIFKFPGRTLGTSFITSFTARFLVEFMKEEQVPFEQAMLLNMGQLLSIPFILIGLILLWQSRIPTSQPSARIKSSRGRGVR